LLLDWLWPELKGTPAPQAVRAEFHAAWRPIVDRLLALPGGWLLRDYHSPNLIWLPQRSGMARVGILDFQDAVDEHFAFDLVSLLQDARVDVSAELESELFEHYCAAARSEPRFDEAEFTFAYNAFGAQRNTKILGIFARLARRDGKPQYLAHLPRIWGYLERNLGHAALASLAAWYDAHFSASDRSRQLRV
jgi:aminoglycoside/choline kinase family phosphotransferase